MYGETIKPEIIYMIGGVAGLLIAGLAVWLFVVGGKLRQLRSRYHEAMGNTDTGNLEEAVIALRHELARHSKQTEQLTEQVAEAQGRLRQMKGRVGAVRYNAFSDGGSDLSFSIAIANEEKDGVVLTGLHSRENTHVYAKPIEKGSSSYPLTPEERKAIDELK